MNRDAILCPEHGELSGLYAFQITKARSINERIDYMAIEAHQVIREMVAAAIPK